MQCAFNSLIAICLSSIKRVYVLKSWDLCYILEQGDALFKYINILRHLSIEEFPETVIIDDLVIKVEMLPNVNRLLGAMSIFENHKHVLPVISNCLIFTTYDCFSLI